MAKQNIDYNFEMYEDGSFVMSFSVDINSNLFNDAVIKSFKKFNIENPDIPQKFSIDPKYIDRLTPAISGVVKKIEAEIKKDMAYFKILHYKLENVEYDTSTNPISVSFEITGVANIC